jgi:hypothetical protein
MKREALAVGLALSAAVAVGGDTVPAHNTHAPVDSSVIFDVPAGNTYRAPLDPEQAQQALATGISCDINSVTSIYNYEPIPESPTFQYPHTEINMDTSLHFTPEAAAAFEQYKHNDGVIWDGGTAAEVYERSGSKDVTASGLKDLGSSILLVSSQIQSPDMTAIVPTASLKKGNVLMPYRTLSLETATDTLVARVPCGQLVETEADPTTGLKITDVPLPARVTSYTPDQEIQTSNYTYSGNLFPTS